MSIIHLQPLFISQTNEHLKIQNQIFRKDANYLIVNSENRINCNARTYATTIENRRPTFNKGISMRRQNINSWVQQEGSRVLFSQALCDLIIQLIVRLFF